MKKSILWIALISVYLSLVACDNKTEITPSSTEKESVQDLSIPVETELIDNQEFEDSNETAYVASEYGEIQEYGSEFYYDENTKGFYYNLECFYLNSDFLFTMNETLEKIYASYLKQYQETEDWYMEQGNQDLPNVPYSKLEFLGIQYIDKDYVSLLFNDITHMGSATAYSSYDAITLDRHTGNEVTASEILEKNDSELLEIVNGLMGLDAKADWLDLDFYLAENKIVFFYRIPGIWEDVTLGR